MIQDLEKCWGVVQRELYGEFEDILNKVLWGLESGGK